MSVASPEPLAGEPSRPGCPSLDVRWALSHRDRRRGLSGRTKLGPRDALGFITRGPMQTLSMKIPIDMIMLDKSGCVLAIKEHVLPYRIVWAPRSTRYIVECAAGQARVQGVTEGTTLPLPS